MALTRLVRLGGLISGFARPSVELERGVAAKDHSYMLIRHWMRVTLIVSWHASLRAGGNSPEDVLV